MKATRIVIGACLLIAVSVLAAPPAAATHVVTGCAPFLPNEEEFQQCVNAFCPQENPVLKALCIAS